MSAFGELGKLGEHRGALNWKDVRCGWPVKSVGYTNTLLTERLKPGQYNTLAAFNIGLDKSNEPELALRGRHTAD
eukprot:5757339-Prymnesium_polylepis.1